MGGNYQLIRDVLDQALEQASTGKGEERHGKGLDFGDQPMLSISAMLNSPDGMAYQAVKKVIESRGLSTTNAKVAELLGAINYIAGMVIYYQDEARRDGERTVSAMPPLKVTPTAN